MPARRSRRVVKQSIVGLARSLPTCLTVYRDGRAWMWQRKKRVILTSVLIICSTGAAPSVIYSKRSIVGMSLAAWKQRLAMSSAVVPTSWYSDRAPGSSRSSGQQRDAEVQRGGARSKQRCVLTSQSTRMLRMRSLRSRCLCMYGSTAGSSRRFSAALNSTAAARACSSWRSCRDASKAPSFPASPPFLVVHLPRVHELLDLLLHHPVHDQARGVQLAGRVQRAGALRRHVGSSLFS